MVMSEKEKEGEERRKNEILLTLWCLLTICFLQILHEIRLSKKTDKMHWFLLC